MKVLISYPPLNTEKGCPTLGQNRQFQYFQNPTFIYPVVPAVAATRLVRSGHEVLWNDCAAEAIGTDDYLALIRREKPDLVVFETKTPVVEEHWNWIRKLKDLAGDDWALRVVLIGDHVTALPEESMRKSAVDLVVTGGYYDFVLPDVCRYLDGELAATALPGGVWYRDGDAIKDSGTFVAEQNLDDSPFIDRELTKWKLYAYLNGNYKRTPGTYIMSGRDCWWGRCTFCSWPQLYPKFRVRSVGNVLDEIDAMLETLPLREIMDDTGTFPRGGWLRDFCQGAIEREYHRRILLDCNFRFGAATEEEYRLMKKSGFRFLLFGLESANQETLERVDKNVKVEQIVESCRQARRAGLYPHVTIMFGYPWETLEQARKTFELGRYLLRTGYAYTMQASIVIPYPGTLLHKECVANDWLTTTRWTDYDMSRPVMKIPFHEEELNKLAQGMYATALDPVFLMRKLFGIRDIDDVRYFMRAGRRVLARLKDFAPGAPRKL